jgi:hypothetical protein
MREPRRTRWLVAAALIAALSACTGTPGDPSTSAPSAATESPTERTTSPSSSPSATLTESEAAAVNAENLVREYYRVIDGLAIEPSRPLSELEAVAISSELTVWQHQFERERREGWRQTGTTKIAELIVQSVNLDNADPATGRVPTVEVDVCFDVSDVDVVDGSGTSVITADRPDTGWIRHTVSNYSWEDDPTGGWRVSTSMDLEQAPCETTD